MSNLDILTPDQFVKHSVVQYPTLYLTDSFESQKMAVFDHLFNTIGNGYGSLSSFEEALSVKWTDEFESKYVRLMSGEKFYRGYLKCEETSFGSKRYVLPSGDSAFESELGQFPHVPFWDLVSPKANDNSALGNKVAELYPNFSKKYSIYWTVKEASAWQHKEWLEAIIWFYSRAKLAIEAGFVHGYYPCQTDNETNRALRDMTLYLESNFKDKSFDEISKAYEAPYTGDVDAFLRARCENERKKNLEFVNKTLADATLKLKMLN